MKRYQKNKVASVISESSEVHASIAVAVVCIS